MANALEIGHQGAQTRSDKARADHRFVDRGEMRLLTARAVTSQATMLADLDWTRDDFDLLDDPRGLVAALDASAAVATNPQVIIPGLVDLLGRKEWPLVASVS